jgi:hypothetical protein
MSVESALERTLAILRTYPDHDPEFEQAIAAVAQLEAALGQRDPVGDGAAFAGCCAAQYSCKSLVAREHGVNAGIAGRGLPLPGPSIRCLNAASLTCIQGAIQ